MAGSGMITPYTHGERSELPPARGLDLLLLPGIMIIRILLLPSLDVVLLVLECFLAYLVLMPLMAGNAPADSPEHAMPRHVARQGSGGAAR